MSATPVAIGVDNGGTWIRVCAVNRLGKTLFRVEKPSPPLSQLPVFIQRTLARIHSPIDRLTIGSRGLWKMSKKRTLTKRLKGLAEHVQVLSDVEATWLSAFGSGVTGMVIIAGTGSIAYGRDTHGKSARAGGLGPEKGDEGSGYWIGKQWLGPKYKRYSDKKVASYAPVVIQQARRGHLNALDIAQRAQNHLVDLVQTITLTLKLRQPIPLCIHGSVLTNHWFQKGFLRELAQRKLVVRLRTPRHDVASALALRSSIMGHGSA
jgi:N-acetylglucosamine kinase-like BadF-type ATPase